MRESKQKVEILIADRDDNLRSALKLMLVNDHHNIQISEAGNVESLMRYVDTNLFKLLIIDWNFYRNRAYEIITQYREKHTDIIKVRDDLPPCVRTITDKALQKDPGKRCQTGTEMREAIERCRAKL